MRIRIALAMVAACLFVSTGTQAVGQTSNGLSLTPHRSLPLASLAAPSKDSVDAERLRLALAHPGVPWQVQDGTGRYVEHYEPESKLRLTLGIAVPKMAEEEKYLAELQNPRSPNFHKYLSAEEWNARYAPAAADEQAVVDWLTANGLTVTQRYANRLIVSAEGPVRLIEKAFSVQINRYQVDDELDYSNDREPAIPAHLNGILQYVGGLNNIQRMHSSHGENGHKRPGPDYTPGPVFEAGARVQQDGDPSALEPAMKASDEKMSGQGLGSVEAAGSDVQPEITNGYLDPTDLYSSYGYDYNALHRQGHCCNPANSPKISINSTIDIFAEGDFSDSDVKSFQSQYPYLALNYQHLHILGGGSCCDDEATLDVEWAIATSNSLHTTNDTGQVLVYVSPDSSAATMITAFNAMASNGDSRILSISFGCREGLCADTNAINTTHGIFNSMIGAGWTILVATGDNGTTPDCSNAVTVEYPASDPDVVAVGGTTLSLYSNGPFYSETGWQGTQNQYACKQNAGGSGGGCSIVFSAPGYQSSPKCSNGMRSTPDIALNAGAFQNTFYQGKLQAFGGTSVATPDVAGFIAQENAYLMTLGNICGPNGNSACGPLGQLDWMLYYQGKQNTAHQTGAPHNPFYDITSGCNSNYYTTLYDLETYCAGPGYDLVTGWGSFNALQMAWAINWYYSAGSSVPAVNFSGPGGSFTSKVWYHSPQEISWTITEPGNTRPSGIAGFTSAWDKFISDPLTEPHQGTNNAFYNGPLQVNQSSGQVTLGPLLSEGCHTITVYAWDNTGNPSGNQSYPTVCFDDIPPTVTASASPAPNSAGWNTTPVQVTLTATDPGANASGIANTYFSYGNNNCAPTALASCYTYVGLPLNLTTDGVITYLYFTEDNAQNFTTPALGFVHLDQTPPVTKSALTGTVVSAGVYSSAVTVQLSATDNVSGVATTMYQLDNQGEIAYKGPFPVTALGSHTLRYWSIDVAGNVEKLNSVSFTVDETSTTTISASANPAILGQSLTLKASVAVPGGAPVNAGTVYFLKGLVSLGSGPVINGQASLSIATLPVGDNTIRAEFSGGQNILASGSSGVTVDIQQATAITVTLSPNPAVSGQLVTITAKVATKSVTRGTVARAQLTPVVTGYVQFSVGSTLKSVALVDGVATYATASLPVGSNAIAIQYNGTVDFAPVAAPAETEIVNQGSTATTLIATANPSQYLQAVKLAASVTTAYGAPTGTVSFKDNGKLLGTGVVTGGIAAFTTSALAVGTHSITAVYQGSTSYTGSVSAVVSEVIDAAATATLLTSPLNPAPYGTLVQLPVTVSNASGGEPSGTVTLMNGTVAVGTGSVLNGAGTVTLYGPLFSYPAPGTYSLSVVYGGNADFLPSTSAVLVDTIQKASTTTAVTSSANPATTLSKITFTAKVNRAAGVTPTGSVTFYDGRVKLGTVIMASGIATYSPGTLTAGTHSIFAVYSGDTNYLTSTSPVLSQVVNGL